jgi:crotonobetainyl-CoA:carnitine CoA-transferase CaiB-like acyl-CoA transferase
MDWSDAPMYLNAQTARSRRTLKRLVIHEQFLIDCCRDTVRKVLERLGFSWKKARKLLNKAIYGDYPTGVAPHNKSILAHKFPM